jgi:ribonuclease T2
MPVGKLAHYLLFAALIGISILTYLREQETPAPRTATQNAEQVPTSRPMGETLAI